MSEVTFVSTENEVTFVQVGQQGPSGALSTVEDIGSLTAGATPKTTPMDADSFGLSDSESSGILRKLTWGAFKAAFNGIFARLAGVVGGQKLIGGTGAGDALAMQGTSASGTTGTNKAVRILSGDNGVTESLTILNNGNVGIGNASPGQLVSVGSVVPVNILESGRVAIGVNAGSSLAYRGILDVEANYPDDATNRWSALSYTTTFTPSAGGNQTRYGVYGAVTIPVGSTLASSASVRGLQSTVTDSGSGNIAGFYGSYNSVTASGSGSKGNSYGVLGQSVISGTATASLNVGASLGAYNNGTATSTTVACAILSLGNQGTTTTAIGLSIGGTAASWTNTGTITNCTALLIGSNTSIGTTKKAVDCQSTADSSFMGSVGVGVATPSAKVHVLSTTEQLRLGYDAANYASVTIDSGGKMKIAAPLTWRPPASYTPAANGDLTVEATSNTQLTFRLKGSDSTVRSGTITLS